MSRRRCTAAPSTDGSGIVRDKTGTNGRTRVRYSSATGGDGSCTSYSERFLKEGCLHHTGMGAIGFNLRVKNNLIRIGGPAVPALLDILKGPNRETVHGESPRGNRPGGVVGVMREGGWSRRRVDADRGDPSLAWRSR